MEPTPNERLAATLLGEPLPKWVAARRKQGKSWNTIAFELHTSTDGQVTLTGEALRQRYREKPVTKRAKKTKENQ
jgi:hypothetical protein